MLAGLHAPAVQSDLAHFAHSSQTQRVGQPCHLHLTCSHIHRRAPSNVVRSRSSRRDASEPAANLPCLRHSSKKHKRRPNLSTCAVADEVQQAAAQSSAEPAVASDAPVAAQELKPEAAAAISAAASGTPGADAEKQGTSATQEPSPSPPAAAAASAEQAPAPAQPALDASPAGPATTSTPPTQPPSAPAAPYRGFRNVRHNSHQKGPDSETRVDIGARIPRGPRPTPIPPEEAGWMMPGQTVLAKVVYSNNNGFKVEMANDTRVGGSVYLPLLLPLICATLCCSAAYTSFPFHLHAQSTCSASP